VSTVEAKPPNVVGLSLAGNVAYSCLFGVWLTVVGESEPAVDIYTRNVIPVLAEARVLVGNANVATPVP
jgi:hypothetical protein